MPDEPKPVTEPEVPVTDPPQEEPKPEETTPKEEETTPETAEEEKHEEQKPPEGEVLPEGVTRDEDGQLVAQIGSSIFKGKDLTELWSSVTKSKVEGDSYIAKLKAQTAVTVPDDLKHKPQPEPVESVKPPDEKAIFDKHIAEKAKQFGIDPVRLSWTQADWIKYADDNGLREFAVMDEMSNVKAARHAIQQAAAEEYRTANQDYVNSQILDEETEQVRDLLVESGIDADQFKDTYTEILRKVWNDPKAKNPNTGLLKSGCVVREVSREVNKLVTAKKETVLSQKLQEDIAKGRKAKETVRTPKPADAPYKPPEKKYQTSADVTADILKSLRK